MKLLTKAIENKLAKRPLYSQDGKGGDAEIIVKFFNPCGAGTWYVLEGEKQANGDWYFFGLAEIGYGLEYGYFSLNELKSLRLPSGLTIERDMYFNGMKVKDVMKD